MTPEQARTNDERVEPVRVLNSFRVGVVCEKTAPKTTFLFLSSRVESKIPGLGQQEPLRRL